MVAAGAVVEPGTTIPAGQIWGGNPARFLRELKPEESRFLAGGWAQQQYGTGSPHVWDLEAPVCLGRRHTHAALPLDSPSIFTSCAAAVAESAEHYVGVAAEHLKETSLSLEDIAKQKGLAL